MDLLSWWNTSSTYLESNNDSTPWWWPEGEDPTYLNGSQMNGSQPSDDPRHRTTPPLIGDQLLLASVSAVLGLIILVTVIGNVFVIAAILLERHLQSVANYLIVSLAVADLMVACLVMPLGAVYEISRSWVLGPELCDMWTSSDVLCCTASILHLVAIALDRYWAVTQVDYIHTRNAGRIVAMIAIVWAVALVVSLAPQLGWKDADHLERVIIHHKCLVSQDVSYQIFATCSTFYVPLFVILVLYWKIFQAARKRIHRRRRLAASAAGVSVGVGVGSGTASSVVGVATAGSSSGEAGTPPGSKMVTTAFTICKSVGSLANNGAASSQHKLLSGNNNQQPRPHKAKESLEAKRERKAAKTLAIITGAFVICWLPFFTLALVMPLCAEACSINELAASLFLWLGYFNSTLNPVIYTIFSPEFRQAFKRILCGSLPTSRH